MSVSLDFGLLTLSYSDNLPYAFCEQIGKEIRDISDEIPFEIPESWEWCRLSFANDMYTGNSINESEKKAKYTGLSEGRYYIGTKDVEFNHTIVYDNGVKIPFDAVKFRIAPCSSILMCIEGGSAGRKIAFTDYEVCFGNKLCCFVSWGLDYMFLYGIVKKCTVGEYPKSWIGRSQAA